METSRVPKIESRICTDLLRYRHVSGVRWRQDVVIRATIHRARAFMCRKSSETRIAHVLPHEAIHCTVVPFNISLNRNLFDSFTYTCFFGVRPI
jgi:hypothetical protein